MAEKNKTVLFILYYFPPAASGGTYRPLKFIKYLPDFAYKSVVVAPTECRYDSYDSSLLKEIPYGTEIIRVKPGVEITLQYKMLRKMKLGAWYESQFIPDRHIGYVENAIKTGEEIIKRGGIDLIFTSATPNSIHIAGRELSRRFKIPWVCDFRDPWIADPFYNPPNQTLDKKYRQIESSYFENATAVISFPESRARIERERYPEFEKKIIPINNGYDPYDFPEQSDRKHSGKLRISHIGAITKDRTVTSFLEALSEMFRSKEELSRMIEINFYGDARPPTPQDISRFGLSELTHFHGYVSHKTACEAMMNSDLLFMVLPKIKGSEGIMPLRLFEYIYSKTPIFLIAPKGEASEFLVQANAGVWVENDDEKSIKDTLADFIRKIISGEYKHNPDLSALHKHERKSLTGELANLFDRILTGESIIG